MSLRIFLLRCNSCFKNYMWSIKWSRYRRSEILWIFQFLYTWTLIQETERLIKFLMGNFRFLILRYSRIFLVLFSEKFVSSVVLILCWRQLVNSECPIGKKFLDCESYTHGLRIRHIIVFVSAEDHPSRAVEV